jgi:hypothetical protein
VRKGFGIVTHYTRAKTKRKELLQQTKTFVTTRCGDRKEKKRNEPHNGETQEANDAAT